MNHTFLRYIQEISRYIINEGVGRNSLDERFMRGIEEFLNVPEQMADEFRRTTMAKVGARVFLYGGIKNAIEFKELISAAEQYAASQGATT